jgi:hypothetical protein
MIERIDWNKYNNTRDLSASIIDWARRYTKNRYVIDFGSGPDPTSYVDFRSRETTRLEFDRQEAEGAKLRAEILRKPASDGVVVVFFRVLSILEQKELKAISDVMNTYRNRVRNILICDYTMDERKISEYDVSRGWLGTTYEFRPEWAPCRFRHLTAENIGNVFGARILEQQIITLPAHKRSDAIGLLVSL